METSIKSHKYIMPTDLGIHPKEIIQQAWGEL